MRTPGGSQSLSFQGCLLTDGSGYGDGSGYVSIPFFSGLLTDVMEGRWQSWAIVSIPFFSGLLTDRGM